MFNAHRDYIRIPDEYLFKPVLTGDIPEMQLIVAVYPGIKEATDMLTGDAREYTGIDQSLDGSIATENMNREDPVE
ncbi:hypothetical protein BGZ52_002875, partial [Haplosporangium bisporale]